VTGWSYQVKSHNIIYKQWLENKTLRRRQVGCPKVRRGGWARCLRPPKYPISATRVPKGKGYKVTAENMVLLLRAAMKGVVPTNP
jgi:hypothetical protein